MKQQVIYLSGPMTGIPSNNYYAFHHAEAELHAVGIQVLNPARHPDGLTYEQYMDIDMAMVRACTGVATLPGWSESKGARAEIAYAAALKKPIKDLDQWLS